MSHYIAMRPHIPTLQARHFTGVSYDGGETSLPYAAWMYGEIIQFCESEAAAQAVVDEERRAMRG